MGCAQSSSPHIFFVLGGPGSGKGTQCDNLVRDYKFKHLSVGDLLRQQRDSKSPQAEQIDKYMKQGKLVPSQFTIKLIRKAIATHGNRRYLIDGFPRNAQNWENFKKILKDQVVVQGLVFFQCTDQVMTQRILNRAKTSGRVDDNADAIKLRLQTYHKQTVPVLNIFKKTNSLYVQVDSNQTPQKVYQDLQKKLDQYNINPPAPAEVFFVLGGPGSGKGTQCQILVKQYGFRHLSTGDLLRDAVSMKTPKGKQIQACMKQGKLVSSDLLVDLVQQKLQKYNYQGQYLLDGFPRGQQNINAWDKKLSKLTTIRGVIYFQCNQQQLIKRLLQRGKTSGRSDDNQQTIKKRMKTFKDQTQPVVKKYKNDGLLINVNAMQSVQKVSEQLSNKLSEIGVKHKYVAQSKYQLIPVIGGPGSGKGTQCDKLKQVFGFKHISTGDLLRQQQKNQGLYTDILANYLKQGQLVPSQLLIQLMRKAIRKIGDGQTILIDGFPRNQQNINKWNQIVGNQLPFKNLIYFQCSEEQMSKRLLQRGKTSGRSDDNTQTIKKRLNVFNTETKPLAKKLQAPNFSITVNADQDKDKIFEQLKQKLIQAGYKTK